MVFIDFSASSEVREIICQTQFARHTGYVVLLTFSSPQKEDWGRTKIYQFFTTLKKKKEVLNQLLKIKMYYLTG